MRVMLVLLLLAAKVDTPTAAREPVGKWIVDYRDMSCVLSHQFGSGADEVTIGWRELPLDESIEMLIGQPSRRGLTDHGVVEVALSPGGKDAAIYRSYPTQVSGRRMTKFKIDARLFDGLPDAPVTMSIAPAKQPTISVSLPSPSKAFGALATCNADTMKEWGVDPVAQARVAIRAKPKSDRASWISYDDYPPSAYQSGAQGTTTILWKVGTDGHISDCRVVVKSGSDALDQATCAAIIKRGRYSPALDRAGQPVETQVSRTVTWVMPQS